MAKKVKYKVKTDHGTQCYSLENAWLVVHDKDYYYMPPFLHIFGHIEIGTFQDIEYFDTEQECWDYIAQKKLEPATENYGNNAKQK